MRSSCLDCARKHIAQSEVLLSEYYKDPIAYEAHFWYAIGHISEAEDELIADFKELVDIIRKHKAELLKNINYSFPSEKIILDINKTDNKIKTGNINLK